MGQIPVLDRSAIIEWAGRGWQGVAQHMNIFLFLFPFPLDFFFTGTVQWVKSASYLCLKRMYSLLFIHFFWFVCQWRKILKLSFLQLLIFYMSVQSDGTDTKTTHRHTQIAKKQTENRDALQTHAVQRCLFWLFRTMESCLLHDTGSTLKKWTLWLWLVNIMSQCAAFNSTPLVMESELSRTNSNEKILFPG